MSIFSGKVHLRRNLRNEAITANTNIFAKNIEPLYGPIAFFVVYAVFDDIGVFSIRRTFTDIGVTKSELFNEGSNLTQNAAYVFPFPVSNSETINLHFSNTCTITKLVLFESEVK